jgi:predicted RNase H-like nuclease
MTMAPDMRLESGAVLGIDVGYSKSKPTTGACLLIWTGTEAHLLPRCFGTEASDQETWKAFVGGRKLLAVALDGPLAANLKPANQYRQAEKLLTRGFGSIGKPSRSSDPRGRRLSEAASAIALAVARATHVLEATHHARIHERAVVEAFPTSFLGVMLDAGAIPPHGHRSDAYFEHLLGPEFERPPPPAQNRIAGLMEMLLPGCSGFQAAGIIHHDKRAAVVCALTALCVARRQYIAVGDRKHGYIVLPPLVSAGNPGLQPWAWELLSKNAKAKDISAPDAVVREPDSSS